MYSLRSNVGFGFLRNFQTDHYKL